MSFLQASLFSLSVGIAALIGLARYRKVEPAYHPFILLMWLGLLNEIISILLIRAGLPNAVNSNLFIYLESLLLLWQFRRWQLLQNQRIYPFLILFVSLFWLTETFYFSSIYVFNSYFIILHSIITILLSIGMVNRLVLTETGVLTRNPAFIICISLLLFFTFLALVEIFWMHGLGKSILFRGHVYAILSYVNLFTNLIYALAIVWMPTKRRYTLLF